MHLGKQQLVAHGLGPLPPSGTPRWSAGLLASAWASPRRCSRWGVNQQMKITPPPLPLSAVLPYQSINVSYTCRQKASPALGVLVKEGHVVLLLTETWHKVNLTLFTSTVLEAKSHSPKPANTGCQCFPSDPQPGMCTRCCAQRHLRIPTTLLRAAALPTAAGCPGIPTWDRFV